MEYKICSKCHVEKLVSEFHKDSSSKDGYRKACKECRKKKGVLQPLAVEEKNSIIPRVESCNTSVMADFFTSDDVPVLREMLDWYKENKEKNTNVIDVIQINLPDADHSVRSMRVNDIVWEQWQKFCKKCNAYKSQDLVGQALLEFMEKYKK